MAWLNGSFGWLALGSEAVAYGTLAATPVYQHGVSSTLKLVEVRAVPPTLGGNAPHTGLRLASYVEGGVVLGMSRVRTVLGNIYAHMASLSTNDYSFTGTPTVTSLSAFCDFGGVEYDYKGLIARSIAWELKGAGDYSTISLDFIGQAQEKYSGAARSPSLPADSLLVTPVGLTTFTINGTVVNSCKLARISVERSVSGIDRQRLGSATLPQPVIGNERPRITATFEVELDTATSNNTVAELDKFYSDATLGTIIIKDHTLTGCQPIGTPPDLGRGFVPLTISVEATGLTVTTIAGS